MVGLHFLVVVQVVQLGSGQWVLSKVLARMMCVLLNSPSGDLYEMSLHSPASFFVTFNDVPDVYVSTCSERDTM